MKTSSAAKQQVSTSSAGNRVVNGPSNSSSASDNPGVAEFFQPGGFDQESCRDLVNSFDPFAAWGSNQVQFSHGALASSTTFQTERRWITPPSSNGAAIEPRGTELSYLSADPQGFCRTRDPNGSFGCPFDEHHGRRTHDFLFPLFDAGSTGPL